MGLLNNWPVNLYKDIIFYDTNSLGEKVNCGKYFRKSMLFYSSLSNEAWTSSPSIISGLMHVHCLNSK